MTALCAPTVSASEYVTEKPAILLAAFGTTHVPALGSILNIKDRVEKAFPEYDVHLAFTSNLVRRIWQKRATDADFRRENPGIPEEIYSVTNALTALANIQEKGRRMVLVQSLHVTDGEEYEDLANLVKSLSDYKTGKPLWHPLPWVGVGEPALGLGDGQPAYLDRAATAIESLVYEALASGSALVLMGHGNEHLNQDVFAKLEKTLRDHFGRHIYIGTVEAKPFAEDIVEEMKTVSDAPDRVMLAPLMVVAGDHAINDMASDEDDSWASVFKDNGYAVSTHLVGLGSNNSWADIYIEHLRALAPKVGAKMKADVAEWEKDDEE
ncbi:MAG: sirohydrochlorin cobaltochelatase [Planctomycetes bacterium]|nr:sirohydrochlorin cobaltochelatase [Planctomycetota bacterium]